MFGCNHHIGIPGVTPLNMSTEICNGLFNMKNIHIKDIKDGSINLKQWTVLIKVRIKAGCKTLHPGVTISIKLYFIFHIHFILMYTVLNTLYTSNKRGEKLL